MKTVSEDPFGHGHPGMPAPEDAPQSDDDARGAKAFGAPSLNPEKVGFTKKRPKFQCPYQNRLSHKDNGELQVNGFRLIIYGYCAQDEDCASCAGTLYKPNLAVQLGWGFQWVPCPYCRPQNYRRKVARLKKKIRS